MYDNLFGNKAQFRNLQNENVPRYLCIKPVLLFSMVFRWGHARSRASRFYLKIKTRGFQMKTSNVSEIYWF